MLKVSEESCFLLNIVRMFYVLLNLKVVKSLLKVLKVISSQRNGVITINSNLNNNNKLKWPCSCLTNVVVMIGDVILTCCYQPMCF